MDPSTVRAHTAVRPLRLDLNADVGESFGQWRLGDDAAIMAQVSSANVACGFHAGDPLTMRRSCATAAASGVVIGAHPSYRDLAGFGRSFMEVDPQELTQELIYQIGALQAMARAEGSTVRYVKPRGALYNAIVHHSAQAQAVVSAVLAVDPGLPLLVAPLSVVQRLGQDAGLRIVTEAFADRAYNPDGTLVPRTQPGAVLHSDAAVDGSRIALDAQSLCLHGDTTGAVAMAAAVRAALLEAGVAISGFA
ncbi:5-oxoprolinase subunit PxpA [Arthrobacter sp. LAPM80]|uniref:LamB/YcsF family protein n=1 Tax=Arthrobacter sp. LAPM80 TaxID=3141788 RepID=UPI00398B6185